MKRLWIALAALTACAAALWMTALVLDPEVLRIGYSEPLAPDGPPATSAFALDQVLPDCTLYDLDGNRVTSAALRGPTPTAVEFGSFTCKYCTGQAGAMDQLAEKYRGQV